MNEAELIAAACRGSEDAFEALYKKHLPHVRAAGRAILRTNDLDDLCQETFLLAFTRIGSFQGNSNFRTWITRIAMNQCLMMLRRNRQVTNGTAHLVQLEAGSTDDFIEQRFLTTEDANLRSTEARFDLPKYLQTLKPQQRRLLEMFYLEGLTDHEIADRLGLTVSAVKSKIYNARKRVQEATKEKGELLNRTRI
jgi:RNA polymerase sigma-70 factor, ECF subfamily